MTPNPQSPEAKSARRRGYEVARDHLAAAYPEGHRDLAALRKAVGEQRARDLAAGDWEGVWQASGALDAIREAQQAAGEKGVE